MAKNMFNVEDELDSNDVKNKEGNNIKDKDNEENIEVWEDTNKKDEFKNNHKSKIKWNNNKKNEIKKDKNKDSSLNKQTTEEKKEIQSDGGQGFSISEKEVDDIIDEMNKKTLEDVITKWSENISENNKKDFERLVIVYEKIKNLKKARKNNNIIKEGKIREELKELNIKKKISNSLKDWINNAFTKKEKKIFKNLKNLLEKEIKWIDIFQNAPWNEEWLLDKAKMKFSNLNLESRLKKSLNDESIIKSIDKTFQEWRKSQKDLSAQFKTLKGTLEDPSKLKEIAVDPHRFVRNLYNSQDGAEYKNSIIQLIDIIIITFLMFIILYYLNPLFII